MIRATWKKLINRPDAYFMIIEMAIRFPFMLIRTNVFKVFTADTALKALRMPSKTHSTNNPSNNTFIAATAYEPSPSRS